MRGFNVNKNYIDMMRIHYLNEKLCSDEQLKDVEKYFLDYIGDVKIDFDKNDVFVTIDMEKYPNVNYGYSSTKIPIGTLIAKVERYRQEKLKV